MPAIVKPVDAKPACILRSETGDPQRLTGACFSSVEEAVAQARHDACLPRYAHQWPVDVVDYDAAREHLDGQALLSLPHYGDQHLNGKALTIPKAKILVPAAEVMSARCECGLCEFHRLGFGQSYEARARLGEELGLKRAYEMLLPPDRIALAREHGLIDKAGRLQMVFENGQWRLPPVLRPMAGGSQPAGGYAVTWTAVALSAATAKTCAGILAGANEPVHLVDLSFGGDATTGSLLAEIVFGTNASNAPGTNSTSFTALQERGPTGTLIATAGVTWTTEPTVLTVIKRWRIPWPFVPPQQVAPLGREVNSVVAASTSGKFIGLRLNSSGAVTNSDGYLEVEE